MKVSKLEILKLRLELQVCDGEMVSKLNARILSLREVLLCPTLNSTTILA